MTTDSTTAATVYSYDTADVLEGTASPELVEASLAAGDAGAVAAYLEAGVWRYVPDSDVEHHERHLGHDVVTVYVEVDEDEDEPEPTVEEIERLEQEAGQAGDLEQAALCRRALEGDAAARAECARVIRDAQAMD